MTPARELAAKCVREFQALPMRKNYWEQWIDAVAKAIEEAVKEALADRPAEERKP